MKIKHLLLLLTILIVLTNTTTLSSHTITKNDKESTIALVVGFGPFLHYDINPSELIAAELHGEIIQNTEIIGLQVQPNLSNFTESIEIVYQAIETYNPDYVFSIGLAAKFTRIKIEKIGYNLKKINTTLEKLLPNGRWLRISPFPALKIVRNLRNSKIPSRTSLFAGLSLCNGMLYSVLHYIDIHDLEIKSGFIHVPLHKSEGNPEGMELQTMVNATRIIIQVCIEHFSK